MKTAYRIGDRVHELELVEAGEGFRASLNGKLHTVRLIHTEAGAFTLEIDGRIYRVDWATAGSLRWVAVEGRAYVLDRRISRSGRVEKGAGGEKTLRAPMPGQVRTVNVSPGDEVEIGQTVVTLEAMKMEIRVRAPAAGRVARLLVEAGESVEKGQALAEMSQEGAGQK